jgi:hypothetical protein
MSGPRARYARNRMAGADETLEALLRTTPRSSSKTSATASGSATTQNAPDNPLARPPLFPG